MEIQWIEADVESATGTFDALDETLETYQVRKIWYMVESLEDAAAAVRELTARDYTVAQLAVRGDVAAFSEGYANVCVCTKDLFLDNEAAFAPLTSCVDVLVMDALSDHTAFACIRWLRRAKMAPLRVLWT